MDDDDVQLEFYFEDIEDIELEDDYWCDGDDCPICDGYDDGFDCE